MKAIAVFPKEKRMGMVDAPEPGIQGGGQVKVRMLEVGICGTDKEIARFEYGEPPEGSDYLILGHESLGEVVEAGSGTSSLKKGDLVVMMVRRPCSEPGCLACRAGRQDFCYTGKFTERGIKGRNGFMTEFIVDEERYAVLVPQELRDVAILTEPMTIAEKAFTQILTIQSRLPWISPAAGSEPPLTGRHALVLGAGPVGLLGAMKLIAAGADTWVYSREASDSPKAKMVGDFGGRYLSSEDVPANQLENTIARVDVVYEATGAAAMSIQVLGELSANAIFVFTGVPGRAAPVELNAGTLMKHIVLENQVILGTVNAGRDAFEAAVRDLAVFRKRFGNQLSSLITGRCTLDELAKTDMQALGGIKNVIEIAH
jgi:glucose 1-dehydrogenase